MLLYTGAISRTVTSFLMTELGWDTLKLVSSCQKHVLSFKIINGLSVSYLTGLQPMFHLLLPLPWDLLVVINYVECLFAVAYSAVNLLFFPSMICLWNTLPQHVIHCRSLLYSFKLSLSTC